MKYIISILLCIVTFCAIVPLLEHRQSSAQDLYYTEISGAVADTIAPRPYRIDNREQLGAYLSRLCADCGRGVRGYSFDKDTLIIHVNDNYTNGVDLVISQSVTNFPDLYWYYGVNYISVGVHSALRNVQNTAEIVGYTKQIVSSKTYHINSLIY